MSIAERGARQTHQPTFAELYVPKLVTVLREGYGLSDVRADVISGLSVAIVALPLSMAIAIASGTTPDRGLYTAVIGGFIVSLLGGSRFQIGGPAGAFIVLVPNYAEEISKGLSGAVFGVFIIFAIFLFPNGARQAAYLAAYWIQRLIGGSNKQITLQPLSVEGSVGLNLAVGIGEIELKYVPKR